MKQIKVNWKRLSIALLLIAIASSSYNFYAIFANPSGQNGSIEGGGFCAHDFVVYNNTVDNLLYAMQCSTGINVGSAQSDLGTLFNSFIFPTLSNGGYISLRSGLYSVVTPINFNGVGAYTIDGTGFGEKPGQTCCLNIEAGTFLMAKTNGMTMIEGSTAPSYGISPAVTKMVLENFALEADGLASIGINFAQKELGGTKNILRHINAGGCDSVGGCSGFTTSAVILDGNEDAVIEDSVIGACGGCVGDNTLDVQWRDTGGDVNIVSTFMGGITNLVTCAQNVNLIDDTVSSVKVSVSSCNTVSIWTLTFQNDYMANTQGSGRVQLNTGTIEQLSIFQSFIGTFGSQPMFVGTGTVLASNFCGNTLYNSSGAWTNASPTLSSQSTCGTLAGTQGYGNYLHDAQSAPSSFPFSLSTQRW